MGSIFFFTKKSIEKNLPKSVGQRSWTFCGSIWEHKADLIRLAIVAHVSDLVPRLLVCVCSHVLYRERERGGWCKEIFGKTIFYNMSIRYMYVSISIQNDPCATKMYFYRICEHSGTLSLSMSKWSIKFILIPLNVISIISSLSKWQLGSGELDCMLHYLYIIQRFVVKINGCLIA